MSLTLAYLIPSPWLSPVLMSFLSPSKRRKQSCKCLAHSKHSMHGTFKICWKEHRCSCQCSCIFFILCFCSHFPLDLEYPLYCLPDQSFLLSKFWSIAFFTRKLSQFLQAKGTSPLLILYSFFFLAHIFFLLLVSSHSSRVLGCSFLLLDTVLVTGKGTVMSETVPYLWRVAGPR